MATQAQIPVAKVQAALELKRRRSARKSLLDYAQFTLPRYTVNWHHTAIAALLEQVCWGSLKRVMIFSPPRHGKSELVSIRFPSFYLGTHPQHSVIGASYDLELARSFSRAVRDNLLSDGHQRLFPCKLATKNDTHWMLEGKEDLRNSFIAAGTGGGITGQGANLLDIDDPIRNYEDALSQVKRDTCWNWFTSTARTRLAPNGAIILTLTRWHEDDLAGRLIRLALEDPTADQWVILELPGENGPNASGLHEFQAKLWATDNSFEPKYFDQYEALWPSQYSAEFLRSTRATMGTLQYSALYGCSPKAVAGNIIKREWFNRWYVTPDVARPTVESHGLRPGYSFKDCRLRPDPEKFDMLCQSWDMAFKDKSTSDFVAGGVWGRQGAEKWLLDRICERLDFPGTKRAVMNMTERWPLAHAKYVEDKANGTAVISDLQATLYGLIAVEPVGSKEARLHAASPDAEAGNIVLPHPSIAPWVYDFIECLCAFPNGLHDDDADMYSQAIYKLKTSGIGLVGLWRRDAEALKLDKAAGVQVQESSFPKTSWAGNAVQKIKNLGKVMKSPQQPDKCPTCGNAFVQKFADGRWNCNECGDKGQ